MESKPVEVHPASTPADIQSISDSTKAFLLGCVVLGTIVVIGFGVAYFSYKVCAGNAVEPDADAEFDKEIEMYKGMLSNINRKDDESGEAEAWQYEVLLNYSEADRILRDKSIQAMADGKITTNEYRAIIDEREARENADASNGVLQKLLMMNYEDNINEKTDAGSSE